MFISLAKVLLSFLLLAVISKVTFLGWYELSYTNTSFLEFLTATAWGVRFDLTVAFLLSCLGFLLLLPIAPFSKAYQLCHKAWLVLCGSWIIFTTVGDTIYLSQASRHVTVDLHLGKGVELELVSTALTQFGQLILVAVVLLAIYTYVIIRCVPAIRFTNKWYSSIAIAFVWVALTVTAVRGGFSDKPQSPMYAYKIGDVNQARIAWSAPYGITYYSIIGEDKSGHRWTPELLPRAMEELRQQLNPTASTQLETLSDHDVIVVLLESWTAFDMKSYGSEFDSTPFFDSLRKESLTTTSFYSNGFRTVEGIFTTMCSQPNPVGGSVAGTRLESMPYQCLPQILKQKGWHTTFVQGSGQGMVGAFSQVLGFTDSFGKFDYEDVGQEQNYWGYMDDGIYDFALEKLASHSQPQFMAINTGTTHDSYLPNESDYAFGKSTPDEIRRSVVNYSDQSLERFVSKLKAQAEKPTLLVLVADHTMVGSRSDLRHVSIPFLMVGINTDLAPRELDVAGSHKDIAPTILDWLGGEVSWFSGQSLLSASYQAGADFTVNNQFFWAAQQKLVRINATSGDKEACYRIGGNTTTLIEQACNAPEFYNLYQQGKDYMLYSQQHLFDGTTQQY
ncbi:LTA synthase family protein [Vibrio methylphosphonaticus]|uniref:LTA synthase family protein n=1 Tax=Vibrio methylphosphonaticus TaxID=2946866 RepID=UPI00202AC185|nr:alkaline phosphatase family protein [Vibrio methylphosphonaticus]MCL9773554.1 sulfatase-like hydrolase/transferase [Vibrio methylphosphonaticus]